MADKIDLVRSVSMVYEHQRSEKLQVERSHPVKQDKVSLEGQEQAPVGKTYGPQGTLNVGSAYEVLRSLVIKTLQDQGAAVQISTGDIQIDLNELTPEDAQALVAEDGYFGVEQTSQRIVDFAINAFGNDPSKLQKMKDAVDKGFSEAQEAFGGTLPEISQQTYDAIMEKLDAFAEQADNADDVGE